MSDNQKLEANAGPGPRQGPVDPAPHHDLERQAMPEKPELTSQVPNLASVTFSAS